MAVLGKPASPVVFNSAAFGANNCPAPDSYYHIDEGTGLALTNIGKDAGNYDGVITGADWETDDTSPILSCVDDNLDFIEFPIPGITGFPFTLAIWVEIDETGSNGDLIGIGDSGTNNIYHTLPTTVADRVQIRSHDGTTTDNALATPSAASNILNVYHMVVGVWASNTSKIVYVGNDGSATLSTNIGFGSTPDVMRVAARSTPSVEEVATINVAGIAVWKSVALTAAQVQTDLYNGGAWPPFVTTQTSAGGIILPVFQRGNLNSFIK